MPENISGCFFSEHSVECYQIMNGLKTGTRRQLKLLLLSKCLVIIAISSIRQNIKSSKPSFSALISRFIFLQYFIDHRSCMESKKKRYIAAVVLLPTAPQDGLARLLNHPSNLCRSSHKTTTQQIAENKCTSNSSVDDIGDRYTRIPITTWTTQWLKNFTTTTQFPHNVRLCHRRIVTFWAHCDFLIIAPCEHSYLLTAEFMLINIYGSCMQKHARTTWCKLKFLLRGLDRPKAL